MNRAIISEQAFVDMVCAAAEVFKKETYGHLFGYRRKSDVYVQMAIPHQTSVRTTESVSIDLDGDEKLRSTVNFLKGYRYLGEFHSHGDGHCVLSRFDKEDMIESGELFTILIAMERTKKYEPWRIDIKDKMLSGSVDEMFKVKLKAFRREPNTRTIRKMRLRCDFCTAQNRRIKRNIK